MMAWAEDEAIGPDVALAGLHVSERIGRDARLGGGARGLAQPDLEEALEASRYASHPYSSHPKEVTPAPPPAYFLLGSVRARVVDLQQLPYHFDKIGCLWETLRRILWNLRLCKFLPSVL
ncbi:hypothetical protein ZWY2020_042507 [Hordeum vulgare]|nr:hypothetical protein ZWY2020_042507 [Hordeum vulgare]